MWDLHRMQENVDSKIVDTYSFIPRKRDIGPEQK